ncbi:hypothetical protein EDD11_001943 [Mortierella claussenii]|nr:hypothetical protein EDD11_001943 [Mortierella claussenii]
MAGKITDGQVDSDMSNKDTVTYVSMGTASKPSGTTKKNKKRAGTRAQKMVGLLRNPFSDTASTLNDPQSSSATHAPPGVASPGIAPSTNPFEDMRRALLGTKISSSGKHGGDDHYSTDHGGIGLGEDDNDDSQDEERILQARRDALAALDPKNKKSSRTAEFKSLKRELPHENKEDARKENDDDDDDMHDGDDASTMSLHQQPPSLTDTNDNSTSDNHPTIMSLNDHGTSAAVAASSLQTLQDGQQMRPQQQQQQQQSHRNSYRRIQYKDNMPSISKARHDFQVPEIAISSPTPSPPPSSCSSLMDKKHRRQSSIVSTVSNPALLSTSFTPSPLSNAPLEDLSVVGDDDDGDETDEWGLPTAGAIKHKLPRARQSYRDLFHRIGLYGSHSHGQGNGVAEEETEESVEDHIGAQISQRSSIGAASRQSSSSIWSLKRDTFGKTGHHQHDRYRQKEDQPALPSLLGGSFGHRRPTKSLGNGLNPWGSEEDTMLTQENATYYITEAGDDLLAVVGPGDHSSLKGCVGGGRWRSGVEEAKNGSASDWMVHPRTAATQGMVDHGAEDEDVPVPHRNKHMRPMLLDAEYTTISLASPSQRGGNESSEPTLGSENGSAGASLTRRGSLDSPLHKLRHGAASLLTGTTVSATADEDKDMLKKKVRPSSTTCEVHTSSSSSPPWDPQETPFTRFSYFRELISSATAAAARGLNRSSNVNGSGSGDSFHPEMLSSTAVFIPRSRSAAAVAVAGHQNLGQSQRDGSFFSSIRRKNTSGPMVPKVVIPHYQHESQYAAQAFHEQDALSAITLSNTPNSASSSVTMFSSPDAMMGPHYPVHGTVYHPYHPYGQTGMEQSMGDEEQKQEQHQEQKDVVKTLTTDGSRNQLSSLTRVATSAAAQRTLKRSPKLMSPDSLKGLLTSDDYIGLFERERERARCEGARGREGQGLELETASYSTLSLATTVQHDDACSRDMVQKTGDDANVIDMAKLEHGDGHESVYGGYGYEYGYGYGYDDQFQKEGRKSGHYGPQPMMLHFGEGYQDHKDGQKNDHDDDYDDDVVKDGNAGQRGRPRSEHPDVSDKLMQLPEPSFWEGCCSCRGVVNITSMILIMSGLILLVLGYPIANSLRKAHLAEEASRAGGRTLMDGKGGAGIGGGLLATQVKFSMENRIAARSMRSLTAVRQYATSTQISAKALAVQKAKAAAAASGKRLTNYGKEFRPQNIFLHHTYSNILKSNRILLICQHNNMSVPETIQVRKELAAAGAQMSVVRLGVFSAALRETRYANLAPLINGPTCVISCNLSPEEEEAQSGAKVPQGLSGIRKVVEKHSKMLLLGGSVDDSLVSVDDMKKMVEMPGIQTLRSQVVGLLSQAGGGRLVQLLNMNPTLLVMNLNAHAKSGDKEETQA